MNRKLTFACSLLALTVQPSVADTPTKTTRTFDIVREGSNIGTDVVEIDKAGDTTTVKFKTHISVVVMFIEAYHFDHTSSETWKGKDLVSFKSQTDDNGKKHVITATAAGDKIQFEVDGKRGELPKTIPPASFWSRPSPGTQEMFDESNGKRLSVKITDLGDEAVTVHGSKRPAHHFRISGDLERDLWFDGDVLVRLKIPGSDGSKIYSDLRS